MKKKIGITCDEYKTNKFRKGLLKGGYTLEYDGPSGIADVHLFRIDVDPTDYNRMLEKIGKTVRKLELEFKRSN